mgnify:CR=1
MLMTQCGFSFQNFHRIPCTLSIEVIHVPQSPYNFRKHIYGSIHFNCKIEKDKCSLIIIFLWLRYLKKTNEFHSHKSPPPPCPSSLDFTLLDSLQRCESTSWHLEYPSLWCISIKAQQCFGNVSHFLVVDIDGMEINFVMIVASCNFFWLIPTDVVYWHICSRIKCNTIYGIIMFLAILINVCIMSCWQ